ncbi:MAG: hypothetical protein FWG56_02085, partial [Desulfovibrionaceae bacterium]|nr:hypothetical protein [Desulfovibrionaceae bacterium]
TSASGSRSSPASWYLRVKVYSIALFLCTACGFLLLAARGAVVHDAPQGPRVVAGVLRRAPYAGDAKLAAAAFLIVVRTINAPPSMAAADFNAPAQPFGVPESFLDFFLRMRGTRHCASMEIPDWVVK